MSIIIEGADGTGKSYLAQDLRHEGYAYEHHGLYPDDNAEQLYNRYRLSILKATIVHTVIDRCYLSEFVYGIEMRGDCRLNSYQLIALHKLAGKERVREIICLPPWEVALANWQVKHEADNDYVDREEKYKRIYELYKEVAAGLGLEVYDYTKGEFKL